MCTRFSTEQLRGACVSADTLVGLEQSETKDKSSLLDEPSLSSQTTQDDIKTWEIDQKNPLNWPAWRKGIQLAMLCSSTLLTCVSSSILSPSIFEIMEEFNVSRTISILTTSVYILAIGFGPVIGGPVSETIGRFPVYMACLPLGGLFTLGAAFTPTFGALCGFRFLAGLCWGPVLAVAPATINETFRPRERGLVSFLFILMIFLGPGLGPVIGSFVTTQKGWRWNMLTLLFSTAGSILLTLCSSETFGPKLKRRLAKKRGEQVTPRPPLSEQLCHFAMVSLIRPLHMLFFEPIVAFVCIYGAFATGMLFNFLNMIPYVFTTVYGFSSEECGLVFLSIVIGSALGIVCMIICDVCLYRRQIAKYAPDNVPPEHRLYPAMFGSIGLPIGLFWLAWTAREDVSWMSPAAAIIPYAFGNMCISVGSMQYLADTYHSCVLASGGAAYSLARYTVSAALPLFIIQLCESLTISWAGSLWGFLSLTLLPIPWVLFKYGPKLRARSIYDQGETHE